MTGALSSLLLVVEDRLSEFAVRKAISISARTYSVTQVLGLRGKADIRVKLPEINRSASTIPFLVIVDLDSGECAPSLLKEWLPFGMARNLLFRVAVREIESWLLADRDAFAKFLGVRSELVSGDPDSLADPKRAVMDLARRCRRVRVRDDIVPRGSASKGPLYNNRLGDFVLNYWRPRVASRNSDSLRRFIQALDTFGSDER